MRYRIGNCPFPEGNSFDAGVHLHSPTNATRRFSVRLRTQIAFTAIFVWGILLGSAAIAQQPSTDSDLALYKTAIELIDKEKYGPAQTKLAEFIKRATPVYDQDNRNDRLAEARFYHAYAAFNLLHGNAQSLFEGFIADYPSHPRVDESRFFIGKLHFMRRDYDRVLPALKPIDSGRLKRDQVVQTRFMMGYCYYKKGQNREAMNMFRQIRNADGTYGEMGAYYYALISYNNGSYNEAYTAFSRIPEGSDYAKNLDVYKASCLLKLERYDELDALGEQLLSKKRTNNEVWFILGNAAFDQGKYDKTITYFEKFEKGRGSRLNREGQYRLGYSYYQKGNFGEASNRFEDCLQKDDAISQNAYYYLGHCFLKKDNYESARTAFAKAADLKFSPDIRREAMYLHAKVAYQTRYFEQAMSALQEFVSEFPDSEYQSEATSLIGECLLYTNNFKEAIAYLEEEDGLKSTRSRAAYQRACYNHALLMYEQGLYDDAIDYFKKSFNQDQDKQITIDSYFWYAESIFRTEAYSAAIPAYNAYLRQPYAAKHRYYPLAHYGKGWSSLRQKNYDQAGKDFEKFIGLANKEKDTELYVDALLRAGDCEFALKNYNGALLYYKQVRDFNNMHVDYALYQIGLLYFRKTNYKKAAEAHVRLAANYRKSEFRDDALITAGETYLTWLDDWGNCAKYCRILVRDHKDSPFVPGALTRLAISEYRSGNSTLAVKYYKQVVNDHCESSENVSVAMSGLADMLSATEYDKVESQYRKNCKNSGSGGNSQMENLAIEVADQRFFEDNFGSAKEKYSNYIADYPRGANINRAHYFRGQCQEKLGNAEAALQDYALVYDSPKGNEYTVKSLKAAADLLYNQGNNLAAMELYTAMEERSDKLGDRLGAQFGKAQIHLANADFQAAKTELLSIYSDPNTTDYSRTKARVQIGVCEYNLGNLDDAFRIFTEIEEAHENVFGAESQHYITQILYDRGEYEQSRIAALALRDNYPGYNYWKARAYLVMAEDYLALGDTFQATKGTLESLANQDMFDDVRKAAEERLAEIEALRNAQDRREAPVDEPEDVDEMIEEENQ